MPLSERAGHSYHTLRIMRWISYGVLVLLAGYSSWQIAVSLRPKPIEVLASTTSTIRQPVLREGDLVERLTDAHLFGIAPPPATSAAPVSSLSSVRVIGILSGDPPEQGWAILDVNGNQHSYQAGATLPDGENLAAVQPDRVILEKSGNRYSVLWDMQQANLNDRVHLLNLRVAGTGDNPTAEEEHSQTSAPVPSVPETLQALHDLRKQLLNKPRLPLSPEAKITPPSNASNSLNP